MVWPMLALDAWPCEIKAYSGIPPLSSLHPAAQYPFCILLPCHVGPPGLFLVYYPQHRPSFWASGSATKVLVMATVLGDSPVAGLTVLSAGGSLHCSKAKCPTCKPLPGLRVGAWNKVPECLSSERSEVRGQAAQGAEPGSDQLQQ